MKNLVDERPVRDLHGRLAWSRLFVDPEDCADRDVPDIGCGFGWFELLALDRNARSITSLEPTPRLDREWQRPGFSNVFVRARKPRQAAV